METEAKTYGTPTFVFATDTKAYRLQIRENDKVITDQPLHDPFITTTIKISPINVLRILLGRYKLVINVSGNREAMNIVMGSDYTPKPVCPACKNDGRRCIYCNNEDATEKEV